MQLNGPEHDTGRKHKTTQSRPVGSLASLDSIAEDGGVVQRIQLATEGMLPRSYFLQITLSQMKGASQGVLIAIRSQFWERAKCPIRRRGGHDDDARVACANSGRHDLPGQSQSGNQIMAAHPAEPGGSGSGGDGAGRFSIR